MDEKKGLLDAKGLACYIIDYFKESFNGKDISPLKLQKTLYFCFAYWGGFARKSNKYKDRDKEIILNLREYLYEDKIEAWLYGPVIPSVYREKDLAKFKNDNLFKDNEYLHTFIDNILDTILPINDFKLVEISHEDNCWKRNFSKKNMFHNIEIPKEEIIREYANNQDF